MAPLPTSLKPVRKADIQAEISANGERPKLSAQARRAEVERSLRGWLAIADQDRARQSREKRQVEALAEPIRASLVYRGGLLRQSLKRVSRVADSGLGDKEQRELLQTLERLAPHPRVFEMGLLRHLVSWLPGVGSRFRRWQKQCRIAAAEVADLGERMVAAREPFKHTVARLARILVEVRELLGQMQEQLELARALEAALIARLAGMGDNEQTDFLAAIAERLRERIDILQAQADTDQDLVLAVEVLVRNARRLIGGQRQAVAAVHAALSGGAEAAAPGDAALQARFNEAHEQIDALTELRETALAEMHEMYREHDRRAP